MTAQLFQCSACGAPLIPRGNASIMSCPYCHASVVVPQELRYVSGAAAWSVLLFESFTANENNWLVGDLPSKYFAKQNQSIVDGRYRWEAQASLVSSLTTAWLMGHPVSDFHLVVNCKHIRGSRAGSSWGVVFRIQDNQNCYWFRITDAQFFAVSVIQEGQWLQLVDWTKTDAIKPKGVNQVEVIGYGTHFTFLINGRVISEVEDGHFRQGLVGLAIEAYTLGEEITFDFLDMILRAP
jgi:hypothetical protein